MCILFYIRFGVYEDAVFEDLEVEVVAGTVAGRAYFADFLTLEYFVAVVYAYGTHVGVYCYKAVVVAYFYVIAV